MSTPDTLHPTAPSSAAGVPLGGGDAWAARAEGWTANRRRSMADIRAERQARRERVWELRLKNVSLRDIARIEGIGLASVHRSIRAYERQHVQAFEGKTNHVRIAQVAQMCLIKRTMDKIEAANTLLKATDVEARLEGTYRPVKVAATTPDGENWAPVAVNLTSLVLLRLRARVEMGSR